MKRLRRFRFLQAALIALAIAATGYASLFGPITLLLFVAAPATLAAAFLSSSRSERDLRRGHMGGPGTMPGAYGPGQDRPRRSEVVLPWLLASTVGGAVGGLGFVLQFFGQLVLFGGVLGVAQWLVLRRYLERAGLWVPASFFGWFAGSVVGVFLTLPAQAQTTGLVRGFVAWAGLGAFQCLALYGLLGSFPGRRKLVSLWLAVGVIGGVVAAVVAYVGSAALPEEVAASLLPTGLAAIVAGHACAGVVYGVATGVTLAEVLRRRGGGRDYHRAAAETRAALPTARRGRTLRWGLTAAAAGVLLLLSLGVVGVLLFRAGACSQTERTAYGAFAQYGGRRLTPEPNYDLGSCQAFYPVDDRPGEVLAYFAARLRANGWRVEPILKPPPSAPRGSPTYLWARRGAYRYSVVFNPAEGYGAPGPGGKVAIDVYED